MEALRSEIEIGTNLILTSSDPDFDRVVKGMIKAFNKVIDISMEYDPELLNIEEEDE